MVNSRMTVILQGLGIKNRNVVATGSWTIIVIYDWGRPPSTAKLALMVKISCTSS